MNTYRIIKDSDAADLNITTRLLVAEALKHGWAVEHTIQDATGLNSGIIHCSKNDREMFFKSDYTTLTPIYGYFASENKYLTFGLFEKNRIPTPPTVWVPGNVGKKEIQDILRKFGVVVVKPIDANHGDGITVGLSTTRQVMRAVKKAAKTGRSRGALIQKQVVGREYRFLVLAGKVIAVAYRRPPYVVGDGEKTVLELIELLNEDPRRGDKHKSALTKINIDDVADANGKKSLRYIPARGEEVEVLKTSNLSRGGIAEDYTDRVSKQLKAIAVRAAESCFLGIAGVDIMTTDVEHGNAENSFVIEVNPAPGLRMHEFPSVGRPRNVSKLIFSEMMKHATHVCANEKSPIGQTERVDILDRKGIPAKIDTGADSSSIWASHVRIDRDGVLKFRLFGEGSRYYSGKVVKRTNFKVTSVRNSTGHSQLRYSTHFTVALGGKKIRALFNLSDRSNSSFPILIGRRTISGKFFVDVDKRVVKLNRKTNPTDRTIRGLNRALTENPYVFHQKYVKNIDRRTKK
ncbi:MAG: RimK/LysX family protein [Candidatus Nomurabacteria bacterium]|jgi:D-alanine-D-alanine ligase-like ATP-grasp enzyme|nr:RimK/LysX family protein [Candidatus Nomurabacteria bacterium]